MPHPAWQLIILLEKHTQRANGHVGIETTMDVVLITNRKDRNAMKLAYISGAYSAPNTYTTKQNIQHAERVHAEVLRAGYASICPHLNSAFMDGVIDYRGWMDVDIEIVRRCDFMVMVPGWERSAGACEERAVAIGLGMAVYTLRQFRVMAISEYIDKKLREAFDR